MAAGPSLAYNEGMSDQPDTPDDPEQEPSPPDGRGPRPTDPNELAKWIVEQTTQQDKSEPPSHSTDTP